jgi:hypothetical protein
VLTLKALLIEWNDPDRPVSKESKMLSHLLYYKFFLKVGLFAVLG